MLASNDLPQTQFMVRKIREGYEIGEVDNFLDRVEETLKVHEAGGSMLSSSVQLLSSEQVLQQRFTATKFRAGYDVVKVDDFLDQAYAALRHHEKNGYAAT